MNWRPSDEMSDEQRKYVLSKMKGGLGKAIASDLLALLLIGGADFMILLTTDFDDVPIVIWIVEALVFAFFTAVFFQGVGAKRNVSKGTFRWCEATVSKVTYTQHTGHQNTTRGLILNDDLRCDTPQSIGLFKEGMTVLVIEIDGIIEPQAFTMPK